MIGIDVQPNGKCVLGIQNQVCPNAPQGLRQYTRGATVQQPQRLVGPGVHRHTAHQVVLAQLIKRNVQMFEHRNLIARSDLLEGVVFKPNCHAANITFALIFTFKTIPMSKIALITGATAGIGEACAERIAAGQFSTLILTGRRQERLKQLAEQLTETHGCTCIPLAFDIRNRAATEAAWNTLSVEQQVIDVLVNNAGLALDKSPLQAGNPDDWDTMIDTNLKGLLYITRLVTPGMVARRQGHVINIGSIAGRETYPGGNVYCATKFAVEGLSRAMRIDLAPHRVRVTSISPGLVETEFSVVRFKGDAERAAQVYQGYAPLVARDIAETVWFAIEQPPHVNINDINLTCTAQANAANLFKD